MLARCVLPACGPERATCSAQRTLPAVSKLDIKVVKKEVVRPQINCAWGKTRCAGRETAARRAPSSTRLRAKTRTFVGSLDLSKMYPRSVVDGMNFSCARGAVDSRKKSVMIIIFVLKGADCSGRPSILLCSACSFFLCSRRPRPGGTGALPRKERSRCVYLQYRRTRAVVRSVMCLL